MNKNKYLNIRPTLTAAAVAACFSGAVLANPVNPTVVHGTAGFAQSGNILNITNSPNAIINWGSFSIGVNELTRFIQQSGSSAVLNRVIGQDPSAILGALQSNGRVFIINPNGIVFGAGAQVNVAGLVASTLNLSNDDFLNNRMNFTDGAGAGSVVNQGSITGGSVYLIGKAVSNDGLITSPNGEVILAAGNSVELVNPGTPNLRVEIVAPDNEAKNLGTVTADAGRIGIYAGLIQQSGTLRADSAVVEGGRIVLKATKNVHLASASQTSASGISGGTVDIQAGDTTIVEGDIAATGSAGAGGTVQVLGNLVGLNGNANIDASGATQGGTVLVGGDFQGKNPEVQNAFRTYVGQDVTINADAITEGDGGKVIVWADDVTRYYGDISARGGANGGDGGFVEVSGKRTLDFQGFVNTLAPQGATGTLLLDPDDITISTSGTEPLPPVAGGVGYLFADAPTSVNIHPNTINLSATNVILQANEDINVDDAISMTNGGVGITMRAGGFVNVNAGITTSGGAITLSAGDIGSLTSPSQGAIYINAPLDTTAGGFNGGANITLSAPAADLLNSVYIDANVNAGTSGAVNINGYWVDHVSGAISGGAVNITALTGAGSGDINLSGGSIQTLGGGNVYLEAERDIKVTSSSSIVATGGSVGLHSDSDGNDDGAIVINSAVINANNISMTGGNGYAAGNSSNPAGISITNNSQIVANGSMDLRGMGSATTGGYGVLVDISYVHNNGSSTYVEGTGGAGAGNHGVKLANADILNLGATGNIEVFGYGTGSGADGVNIGAIAGIGAIGSGNLRVTGSGSGGGRGINMGAGTSFIGGASATQVFINSLSGGMMLVGSVTACQACGSITLKSTAGADATTAALTASGLRVLGTGTFDISGNNNSLETVAAALSGGPNLLHVHDQGDLQVGAVTSFDGAATTTTTGVNVGIGAGNIVDLHTVGALTNGGGTVTGGGQVILDAASIGATGAGNYMSINRGATGTASLTSSSGGIFVEQAAGSGNLLTNSYTISAPSGQTVALASSGGTLIVGGSLSFAGNDLELYTTGANDIQFNGGAPGTITANSLTLGPAAGNGVLFNSGVSPWNINAPVTLQNNAGLTVDGGQTVNFNNSFTTTGGVSVGAGSTLNLTNGATLTGLSTAGNVFGGALDVDTLVQTGGSIAVSSLTVNASFSQSAGSITGTSGDVKLNQVSGNLLVKSASAYGKFKAVAASGDVILTGASVSGANGPVEIFASGNIDINGGSTVSAGSMSPSNIQMTATNGAVTIQNSSVLASYGGPIDITAATGITLSSSTQPTYINSTGNVTLTSGGNVNVLGGSGGAQAALISGGTTTINASGDVMIAGGSGASSYAEIYAADDVFMTVGGFVHLDDGLGAGSTAQVVSGSPTSVHLHFANLASGGYFINGVEGAITDMSGSGFYAGGSAAVLDTNLIVTYGLTAPGGGPVVPPIVEENLETPTQTLIVALTESTEPPEAEKDKDVFKESDDDKKKDAPMCK